MNRRSLPEASSPTAPLIVQKFGGTSVGSVERIAAVAERVAKCRRRGCRVVVVVSAMAGETDRLLKLARGVAGDVHDLRETDQLLGTGEQVSAALLALALQARGVPARSFTAPQMRLYTDGTFSRARLKQVDARGLNAALARGEVVVATGFQGIDAHGNLTTLGRGGSDTSAVALAATLGAAECEIYTDVLGVYTADPRVCPAARKLAALSFDEMMEMASLGSKVLQIRSVELAMNHNVPLRVRSTFDDDEGTLVTHADAAPIERINVVGISHSKDEAKFMLRGLPADRGPAATLFGRLAEQKVNVDIIVQGVPVHGQVDLAFTLGRADHRRAEAIVREAVAQLGGEAVEVADDVGKVSIVGVGMMSHPGVAARMFAALHAADVHVQLISSSEIKVTVLVARDQVELAVRTLHKAFALDAPVVAVQDAAG